MMELSNLTRSYEEIEEELREIERWLHEIWGTDFYHTLVGDKDDYPILKAFDVAGELKGNVLICDGFSLRELIVLIKKIPTRITYYPGRAPAPTTTQNVVKKTFNVQGLMEAITGIKLIKGRTWEGQIIKDISKTPRIGRQTGKMFLTYYPDDPLHRARTHGKTRVQDISTIMEQLTNLIKELSTNSPLVVTGDHGYIYVGDNANKYMWLPYRRQDRYGEDYKEHYIETDGEKVAVGRYHAKVSGRSKNIVVHGGVSLCESLVPIAIIEASK